MISRITFCSAQPATIALGALRTDPGHLTQAARLLLDDFEHGFAEGSDQLLRVDRPDAADHPGAEIFLDPLDRGRRRRLEERRLELDAVGAVVDPASARLDELAGRDHRSVAKNCDQIALPAGLHLQNAEPVLVVMEGDALDQTGQNLCRGAHPRCLRHGHMMEIGERRRHSVDDGQSAKPRAARRRRDRGAIHGSIGNT